MLDVSAYVWRQFVLAFHTKSFVSKLSFARVRAHGRFNVNILRASRCFSSIDLIWLVFSCEQGQEIKGKSYYTNETYWREGPAASWNDYQAYYD